ncbi:MAG TPA: hypothetical protein VI583_15375 [Cyclobacteriaceae bacterium]|nr:hypothetical protein [Cyclobacteriaceae bacterium]
MTIDEFKRTLDEKQPPEFNRCLTALWYEKKGDWKKAHEVSQEIHDPSGSLVHAYLHRREGDFGNAGYWYVRAGKEMPGYSLDQEWAELVANFLEMENK